ncbi:MULTISPECIES: gliding motility-associated ABC transporter permease subunit GldF [unclassified Flammeovirga]|uniref:gliding motility-associated ABC transporter permease subunit GldF n=1 Tax=unclassified Flammeovirga TaxID=2637820 RepID=UPI0005C5F0FF|nr:MULTISPECIES: gliding motility-associated ABC transporter permease subunit GldF [unclassified Flammeovirga]MBD0404551.1 gliding motility-associated ABC transporter permease subunit GldF [Flammeovirga sp. EKP202]
MWQIFQRELSSFFSAVLGYLVMAVFLVMMGMFVWVFPQTSILEGRFSSLDPLFNVAPYVFMFLLPAITMRGLAEEKKTGTLELLFTRPLTDFQIIGGKFFAAWMTAVLALIPTVIYYFSVYELGAPKGNIDTAAVMGSYVGLIFLSGGFAAIGVFASSITSSQIVSFIVAVVFCFICYDGISSVASIPALGDYAYGIGLWGIDFHYRSLSRGLIDSRDILYFFSLIGIALSLAKLSIGSRRWE